ncbi:hypothetical protein Y032_0115g477 [Ancylostoma ceylanicum]|uniref:Uncharacterized protein n=1 Tax=Ancylostoma ceylanicum TaxID=53326 RepID=A0A016TCQ1_9BILA|nr:hypothetical protein Y032_0115g477 [Ancylostoma ceylanicum]
MRRTLELSKAQELNDGEVKPVEKRPTQEQYQRIRRTLELSKAQELNDGEVKPVDKKPSQEQSWSQHRIRRWPLPLKRDHQHRVVHRRAKSARKTIKHKPLRKRRAEKHVEEVC